MSKYFHMGVRCLYRDKVYVIIYHISIGALSGLDKYKFVQRQPGLITEKLILYIGFTSLCYFITAYDISRAIPEPLQSGFHFLFMGQRWPRNKFLSVKPMAIWGDLKQIVGHICG